MEEYYFEDPDYVEDAENVDAEFQYNDEDEGTRRERFDFDEDDEDMDDELEDKEQPVTYGAVDYNMISSMDYDDLCNKIKGKITPKTKIEKNILEGCYLFEQDNNFQHVSSDVKKEILYKLFNTKNIEKLNMRLSIMSLLYFLEYDTLNKNAVQYFAKSYDDGGSLADFIKYLHFFEDK